MRPAPLLAPTLTPGDTIAVVSPSWHGPASDPETFTRGLANLRNAGYSVYVMPHATGQHRWTSGTPEQRAADLHAAFADPDIRGIVCTIGGNHSAQLLPLLDMDLIRAHPTVFCGYSDITVLHHAIHHHTGLVTFYGPAVLPQWGEYHGPFPYTSHHFRTVTATPAPAGGLPHAPYEVHEPYLNAHAARRRRHHTPASPRRLLRPGHGTGPLLAGCLPSIRPLLGTPWQPDTTGRVLILDLPDDYPPEDADADLTHLRLAGLLNAPAAVAFCRPTDPTTGDDLDDVLRHHTSSGSYPVLTHLEGGHTDPLPTYPIGATATVHDTTLTLLTPAVRHP